MLSEQAITNDSRTVAFKRNQATVLQSKEGTHRQIERRPLPYETVDIHRPGFSISTKVRRPFSSVDVGAVFQWCKEANG